MTGRASLYQAIDDERARQALKWGGPHAHGVGDCSSPDVPLVVKVAVLTEEVGEVARAALDSGYSEALRDELVQVAAVAVAILEGPSWSAIRTYADDLSASTARVASLSARTAR